MAKPRKRPARPAPEEAPAAQAEAPAAAEVPVAKVEVVPKATPAPKVPEQPPLCQLAEPLVPRSPDDIIHNVMIRQLVDDTNNPPADQSPNPALQTLALLREARNTGQPLAPLQDDLARQTSGADASNRASYRLYRKYRNDKLSKYLQADDRLDQTLFRMFNRGELNPTEILVMKKVCQSEIHEMAKELLDEVEKGAAELDPSEATTKMDYTFQMTERITSAKALKGTTPQGREIVRKLVFHARQKLFPKT